MLPSQVESYLVPVEAEYAHGQVSNHQYRAGAAGVLLGEHLRRPGFSPFDMYYDVILPRAGYLATPRLAQVFRFEGHDAASYTAHTAYTATRDGRLTGFKGYFIATLSDTVALDIAGDDLDGGTASDSWKHCYLPIETPILVRRGDRIVLSLVRSEPHRDAFSQSYEWRGQVLRRDTVVGRFVQRTIGAR
jgi:protein arginine N-methyltransferase 1